MPESKNPIFPRWHDPHFGMSRNYLAGKGDGDPGKGYDMVLDKAIESWNKGVDAGADMPRTSRENGMDWIPMPHVPEQHKRNREEFEREQKVKAK